MVELTWQDKKRIGEALGYHIREEVETFDLWQWKVFCSSHDTEQAAWDAYQPDVLGEVIPWLEKHCKHGIPSFELNGGWAGSVIVNEKVLVVGYEEYPDPKDDDNFTFSEAVCALMLAVLDAGVPA